MIVELPWTGNTLQSECSKRYFSKRNRRYIISPGDQNKQPRIKKYDKKIKKL